VVDGIAWHVVEAGPPSAVPVVLVAGFPQSAYAWRRVIPVLAREHRVLAVDLPGQGYTPATVDGYDTTTTSHRVRALLRHLGVGRHVYVGHDVGPWVGFAHAHLHPRDLYGVALLDANIAGVTLPASIELGPDSWRSWHFFFNALEQLPEALLTGRERVLIEWFFAHKALDWRAVFTTSDLDEYESVHSSPPGMSGVLGYYRAVQENARQNTDFSRSLIQVPVLALAGDHPSLSTWSETAAAGSTLTQGR